VRGLGLVVALSLAVLVVAWRVRREAGASARAVAPPPAPAALGLGALAACVVAGAFALRGRTPFDFAGPAPVAAWAGGATLAGALAAYAALRVAAVDLADADPLRAVRRRGASALFALAASTLGLAYLAGLITLAHTVREDALVGVPVALVGFGAGQAIVYGLGPARGLDALALDATPGMVLAATLAHANAERLPMAALPPVLSLPLVVRALGGVAAIAGLASLRDDDAPGAALPRGALVTAFVAAVGTGGAVRWALGDTHVLAYYYCGLLGVLAGLALTRAGSRSPFVPIMIAAAVAGASYALGARSGLAAGGAFGVAVALSGAVAVSVYALALGGAAATSPAADAYASGCAALATAVGLAAVLELGDAGACGAWLRDLRLPDASLAAATARCREVGPVLAAADLRSPAAALGGCVGAALAFRLGRMVTREARPHAWALLVLVVVALASAGMGALRHAGPITLAAMLAVGAAALVASSLALRGAPAAARATLRAMLVVLVAVAVSLAPAV
jgi:hypothetical protein